MTGKLVLVGLLSVALALVESAETSYSDEDTLRTLTEEGSRKVSETLASIDGVSVEYDKMVEDRLECLMWEYAVQKETVNKSIADAVSKGMQRNKQGSSFQCISNGARETLGKLDGIRDEIPTNSEEIKRKGLSGVTSFRLVMPGLQQYVEVLYKAKSEEMKKACSDEARKKILGEVMQKMKHLETILEQMRGQMKDAKFKFFEDFVKYAYTTDGNLKKTQREGTQKIQKCVA